MSYVDKDLRRIMISRATASLQHIAGGRIESTEVVDGGISGSH